MEIWRFDEKAVLLTVVRELVGRGVALDDIDVKLSEIGPVDLDLLRDCFAEIVAELGGGKALAA